MAANGADRQGKMGFGKLVWTLAAWDSFEHLDRVWGDLTFTGNAYTHRNTWLITSIIPLLTVQACWNSKFLLDASRLCMDGGWGSGHETLGYHHRNFWDEETMGYGMVFKVAIFSTCSLTNHNITTYIMLCASGS